MTIRFSHLISIFAVLLILTLTGCQDSLVETPTEAPPLDPEAPMTEQEFRRQMDETGMVIIDESDYEQFGIELRSPERAQKMADGEPLPKTQVCTDATPATTSTASARRSSRKTSATSTTSAS